MEVDQGAATLIAAVIAAAASLVALIPKFNEWRRSRKMRQALTKLLLEGKPIRSLEWLARRLGITQVEVGAMLREVGAHGVLMEDGKEGAALDSRHDGG